MESIYSLFRRVQAGDIPVDPVIDVVTSLHRSKDEIVQRLPTHMRGLKKLLDSSTTTFRNLLRTSSSAGKLRVGRDFVRQLRKAMDLVEELSPRTEFLDSLVQDYKVLARDLNELEAQATVTGRSQKAREQQTRAIKKLRNGWSPTRPPPNRPKSCCA